MFRTIARASLLIVTLFIISPSSTASAQGWPLVICAHEDNLPYSNRQGDGLENRLAALLADELGATLATYWHDSPLPSAPTFNLQEGHCDLVMSAAVGQDGLETSVSYYQSGYMFVQEKDHPQPISSFDDVALSSMAIGVQQPRGHGVTPPVHALAIRGLANNQHTFSEGPGEDGTLPIVQALIDREIDVAVIWGPLAGYFVDSDALGLSLSFVQPQFDQPFVPMILAVSIGMRSGDVELRDLINGALANRWDEVQELLEEFSFPLVPVPRPNAAVQAQ